MGLEMLSADRRPRMEGGVGKQTVHMDLGTLSAEIRTPLWEAVHIADLVSAHKRAGVLTMDANGHLLAQRDPSVIRPTLSMRP